MGKNISVLIISFTMLFTLQSYCKNTLKTIKLNDLNYNIEKAFSFKDSLTSFHQELDDSLNSKIDKICTQFPFLKGNIKHPLQYNLKSANTSKQQLDSIIITSWDDSKSEYVNDEKSYFLFDENHNNTQTTNYEWVDESWIPYYSTTYEYNDNKNITLCQQQEWDSINNAWINKSKYEIIYGANGFDKIYSYYDWDQDEQKWINDSKNENRYDANQNLTYMCSYLWSKQNNKWVGNYFSEMTYDLNNNQTLHLSYIWDHELDTWIPNKKADAIYDTESNLIQSSDNIWDDEKKQWQTLDMYVFDENQNSIIWLDYIYNYSLGKWVANKYHTYIYDEYQNLIEYKILSWDMDSENWKNYTKNTYNYNSKQQITLDTKQEWDDNTSLWINYLKIEYTYNSNDQEALVNTYNWDDTLGQWINYKKTEKSHYTNGIEATKNQYTWIEAINRWINTYSTTSNENGKITESILMDINEKTGDSIMGLNWVYTYNSDNNLIESNIYIWEKTLPQWILAEKETKSYNDGTFSETITYKFEEESNSTINSSKTEIQIDNQGNRTSYIRYTWDTENNSWIGLFKMEYQFDSNSNRISTKNSEWNSEENDWHLAYSYEYKYNNSYTYDDLILPQSYHSQTLFHNQLEQETSFYEESDEIESFIYDYYYSEINTTGINLIIDKNASIYPNPASDKITVSFANTNDETTLELFNSNGQLVSKKIIKNNQKIDINNLNPGLYIYRLLQTNGILGQGKITIKK